VNNETEINLYGQGREHEAAAIHMSRSGATRLLELLQEALKRGDGVAAADVYASDGEEYTLILKVTDGVLPRPRYCESW